MFAEHEFSINGVTYRAGRMDARTQFHVVRRLATVFGAFSDTLGAVAKGKGPSLGALPLAGLEPLFKAVGALPDEEANYVITHCLAAVTRQEATGWQRVQSQGGALLFQDVDMVAMVRMIFEVLKHNVSGFSIALPSGSTEQPEARKPRASNGRHSRRVKAS